MTELTSLRFDVKARVDRDRYVSYVSYSLVDFLSPVSASSNVGYIDHDTDSFAGSSSDSRKKKRSISLGMAKQLSIQEMSRSSLYWFDK